MTRGDILAERRKSSLEVKGWNVVHPPPTLPYRGTGSGDGSLKALFFWMKTEQLLPEASVSREGEGGGMQYAQKVLKVLISHTYECMPVCKSNSSS